MSNLSPPDRELIESIKRKIEEESGLANKETWTQRDFEFLTFYIKDHTGVNLSLSTVKRIWRNSFHRLPHSTTLNALSQSAYALDWVSLKKQVLEKNATTYPKSPQKPKWILYVFVPLLIILLFVGSLYIVDLSKGHSSVPGAEQIEFSSKLTNSGNIPNTVIFNYNIESLQADSFFIQQSWDQSRKVGITKADNQRSDIYYLPGYFKAKLIADTSIVKEIPVHVISKEWFVAVRQPFSHIHRISPAYWQNKNYLGVTEIDLVESGITLKEKFQMSFYNVRDFGTDGDNFMYKTRVKMDSLKTVSCPTMSLLLKGEKEIFWLMIGHKGCESELGLIISEQYWDGKKNDLSAFGTNMYNWQDLTIQVASKNLTITLNGEAIFETSYHSPLGSLKETSYFFEGIGSIDAVALTNQAGQVEFSDDFE